MMGSTTSSTSAATTSPPLNTEPPEPRPSRLGPRSPALPLGHKCSCDRPSPALSRPEPIKLTVPAPVLAVEAADRVVEEVDRLLGQPGDPGLGRVHLQPEPCHQRLRPRQRRLGVAGTAADDEVVGVVDDVGVELVPVAVTMPGQQ